MNVLRHWFRRDEPRWEYRTPAGILTAPAWMPEQRWRAGLCPTSCDDDCDAGCHEGHQVPAKRLHDPATCPGTDFVARFYNPRLVGPE